MVECERCEEEVKVLTKATNTCPKCAKEELEMGYFVLDNEENIELAGDLAKDLTILEKTLEKEGY